MTTSVVWIADLEQCKTFVKSRGQPNMVDHTWPDPFTPIQAKLGSRLTWLGQSGSEGFLLIIISPSKIVLHKRQHVHPSILTMSINVVYPQGFTMFA